MISTFERLGAYTDKNCKKGIPCGNTCISQSKTCKKGLEGKAQEYANHITNPENLESGADSSEGDGFELVDFEFDDDLNPVGLSPENQAFIDNWQTWQKSQEEDLPNSLAQRLNPDAPPPTEEQANAINVYTGFQYAEINSALRGTGDFSKEDRSALLDFAKEANDGLKALPNYSGETYRGTALPTDVVDKLKVGGTYSDKAFLSTSSSKEVAEGFSSRSIPENTQRVLFTIEGKYGKDISKASEYKSEKEVLFSPSSKFKITSVEDKDGILYVGMKQYGKQK